MQKFHAIHCPHCGNVMEPFNIKFSITDFVNAILNSQYQVQYSSGIVGTIDLDNISLISENSFLWDMAMGDITGCYTADVDVNEHYIEGRFTLRGENLLKRFGDGALELFQSIDASEIAEVSKAQRFEEAIENNERLSQLMNMIKLSIENEILIRKEVRMDNCRKAIFNLISYAKTGKILFEVDLKVVKDKDTLGNMICSKVMSKDGRIQCDIKRCSHCGEGLSNQVGKYEEKIVCFIGSPSAGKTAYLTAAISKLEESKEAYGVRRLLVDDMGADYRKFSVDCLEPYSKGFAIAKTDKNIFPQLSIPLACGDREFLYTFVDIPGEVFIDENGLNASSLTANRSILKHASVLWFCVSAKQLFTSKVGSEVITGGGEIQNKETTDLKTLGNNVNKFVSSMYEPDQPRPAVAIVMTKADMISQYVEEKVLQATSEEKRAALEEIYYKHVCPFPRDGRFYSEDMDISDGEPISLKYLLDENGKNLDSEDSAPGRFAYQRCIRDMEHVRKFIDTYGETYAKAFILSVARAFDREEVPCFAQAAYGRNSINSYSLENAARYLISQRERIMRNNNDYAAIESYFGGAEALRAFENGTAPLQVASNDIASEIKNIHSKYNRVYPFGIMTILMWTFAYTGLINCTEFDGKEWKTIPTSGELFSKLQKSLTLESKQSVFGAEKTPVVNMKQKAEDFDDHHEDDGGKRWQFWRRK